MLAGRITHGFNDLLTGIVGEASLIRPPLPESSPIALELAQIEQFSVRAADLCR